MKEETHAVIVETQEPEFECVVESLSLEAVVAVQSFRHGHVRKLLNVQFDKTSLFASDEEGDTGAWGDMIERYLKSIEEQARERVLKHLKQQRGEE